MILVDTSIWVGHLRHGNDVLATLLEDTAEKADPSGVTSRRRR